MDLIEKFESGAVCAKKSDVSKVPDQWPGLLKDPDEIRDWISSHVTINTTDGLRWVAGGSWRQNPGDMAVFNRLVFIHNDGTVDIRGNVVVLYRNLKALPVRFRMVTGDFSLLNDSGAGDCVLEHLWGCPAILGGGFSCIGIVGNKNQNVKLSNLVGLPKIINGDMNINFCDLKSLDGGPWKVDGHYNVSHNSLESLAGVASEISFCLSVTSNPDLAFLMAADRDIEGCADIGYGEGLGKSCDPSGRGVPSDINIGGEVVVEMMAMNRYRDHKSRYKAYKEAFLLAQSDSSNAHSDVESKPRTRIL